MKFNKIKSVIIASVLAAGTLAGSMSTAQAGSSFGIYIGNGGYNNNGYGGYYSSRSVRPNRHVQNHSPRRKACNPRRAMRIAHRQFGLYQPHVKRVNRQKIVVKGYTYGHPAKIVFKRTRHGCKVIKTRGI